MSEIAIKVQGISKKYKIGQREKYKTLTDTINRSIKKIFLIFKKASGSKKSDEFWALKNINFEVKHGEIVGIIGKNGAGKSTLLKIISRVTVPTEGKIEIFGRIGSLLEVGTGFHSELTGRENIFFSGSIMGMKKNEIEDKLESIINFAEIEKFIDTPVKRYSSGMYVRLAFAVAAHIEPEILLIDEVLAVGDVEFQKKCLNKMKDVSRGGRTILFVSHDMNSIRNLCTRTIWLKKGEIYKIGDTYEITEEYLRDSLKANSLEDIQKLVDDLLLDPTLKVHSIKISQKTIPTTVVLNGYPVDIEIKYSVLEKTIGLLICFDLYDQRGNLLLRSYHDERAEAIMITEPGNYISKMQIPENLLAHRDYEIVISAVIFNGRPCMGEGIRIPLQVEPSNLLNRGYPENALQYRPLLQPLMKWQTERIKK